MPTDTRTATSKVKPRIVPEVDSSSSINTVQVSDDIPPPTPIATLQDVGVNRCAIPTAELTEEALLAAPTTVAPTEDSEADPDVAVAGGSGTSTSA